MACPQLILQNQLNWIKSCHRLVIRPFRKAHITRGSDRELEHLKLYLLKIARLDSLASLRHSRWEGYIRDELRSLHDQ